MVVKAKWAGWRGGGGGWHETTNMPVKKENKEDGWIELIVKAVTLAAQCF